MCFMSNIIQKPIHSYRDTILAERYDNVSDGQYANGLKLIQDLKIKPGQNILDIGCGTGRLTFYAGSLLSPSGTITGIDPSEERITIAKKHAAKKPGINIFFKTGDANHLGQFRTDSFDVIYLNIVFHWVEDKADALTQIYRILKPGGTLGITMGNRDAPYSVKEYARKILDHPRYVNIKGYDLESSKPINESELKNLLEESGFRVRELKTVHDPRYFKSSQACLEYVEASTSGTFLASLPPFERTEILLEIGRILEKTRTPLGVVNTYHTIFSIAEK